MNAEINEFVLRFANVNGTGSASANGLIAKCLFRMGLPIGPKNMFPSNIQGMPTWYEIRVSGRGYTARHGRVDLMVAMNGQTLAADCQSLEAGSFFLYDCTRFWPESQQRKDISYLPLPLTQLARERFTNPRQRLLLQNMIYVGSLAALLNLDRQIIADLIQEQYQAKPKLIPLNLEAVELGYTFAQQTFACPLPFYARPVEANQKRDRIIMDGNTALALGCLYAGATVCAWYPITPSTSVVEAFSKYCEQYRRDKASGRKRYAILQAEDEIAALGMVLGATWMGARAFTATSGPGISLMSEFLGYAYYAEIPAVIFNIQRCGPSTGMPTKTQQSDLLLCAYASHGDSLHLLLFPASPKECFEFAVLAFDLAERFQTPIIVLSDLEIGMNDYISPPLQWSSQYRPDRGKVLNYSDLAEAQGPFYRYEDKDQDGIPWRSYPGTHPRGAYFTRGSGHDKFGRYTEDGQLYQENMDRLGRKLQTALSALPKPQVAKRQEASCCLAILYFGSTAEALEEACDLLAAEGIKLDAMRLRAFPFAPEVKAFIAGYERLVVVEQNRDGQMKKLLQAELGVAGEKLIALCSYDGLPLQAKTLAQRLKCLWPEGEG